VAKSATLQINILSDASGATRGLDQAVSGVERFERGLDRASVAAAAALGGIALLGKQAFDAASALQQSSGAIESVFSASAESIRKASETAAQGVGLSTSAYQEQAANIGALLKNMGQPAAIAAKSTQNLITIGADLAATYGGTTADAVAALGSALRGELDPIERYGISLKDATVKAEMARMGNDNLTGSALAQARATAIQTLIQQQAGGALGAFAREADTAAGQQQRATAEMQNAAATIGEVLLPVVADLATRLADVARWASENSGLVGTLAIVIGTLAAGVLAVNAAYSTWTAAQRVATAVQWAYNAAVSANPLTIIILAVLALIGIIALLVDKFGGIQNVLKATGQVFQTIWSAILGFIQPVIDVVKWLWDKFQDLIDFGARIGSALGGWFSAPAGPRSELNTAPGLYGAGGLRTAGLLTAGGGAAPSPGGAASGAGTVVYKVTVNGALDPTAVAAQIESLTTRRDKNLGRRAPLSFGRGA
jgi:hypothetical protein